MLLSAEQVTKSYGDRVLLDGVSFYLERGDKVGIIGVNGAGKSTLLRLLAGAEEPDGGTVRLDPGVRMEYLPQNPAFQGERTVLEQVLLGLNDADRSLAEYEARTILNRLGVSRFAQSVGALSGGERRRVALAAVLARPCDVLILDEPTNHLDNDMVLWLEDYLRAWKGALVMVTHDRYFLERIVGRMAEVEDGRLFTYEGNYDKYLERKAARLESERASERKRQAILRREYQWVMQGPTARGTKSRERLERYEALKAQSGPAEKSTLELNARASRLGKKTIECRGVTKGFGGRTVVRDFDCMLLRDDRIGIVGANGSGKSTLLNLLAGELAPDAGAVETGETVRVGYFRQEVPDMDGDTRVIDYVKEIGNRIETGEGMPPSCWSSSSFRQRRSGAPSASCPAARSGGSSCCPSWPPPPTCCCWTSRPTIWIFRPSACWRTIWTPSPARWWRCHTTAISWTGWCGGCSPWRGTEASGAIPAGIRSIWRPGGPPDSRPDPPSPPNPRQRAPRGPKS